MSSSGAIDCTSKRFELLTLNTSQRNWRLSFSDHGIRQRLAKPRSTLKNPLPRTWFLAPDSPGNGFVKALMASVPFLKTLTTVFPEASAPLNTPVFTGETRNALPPSCQFVGHWKPLNTLKGRPLVTRKSPDNCQPPIMASSKPWAFPASILPLPNGSSAIQFMLN